MNVLLLLPLQSGAVRDVVSGAQGPVTNLLNSSMEAIGAYTPKIIGAILGLIIGLWIIRLLIRLFRKALERTSIDKTLHSFLVTVVNFLLKAILFISILGIVGVPTASFAAMLAAIGIAIGAAWNGSLGNIASGIMLLVFRPFKVGDLIELPDKTLGFVKEISVFVTILETFQNKTEIVPNSVITSGKISNYTTIGNLRIDMPFGIRYGADIENAKTIVAKVLENDPYVLKKPYFRVAVNNLGENGIELLALPYVTPDNYWEVYWDTRQRIVEALGNAGYQAPLPQRVITMKQE